MICKQCNKDSVRNAEIKLTVSGRKSYKYFDENGRKWDRVTCPDCTLAIKAARKAIEDEMNSFDANPLTKRKCRGCGTSLRASHYFNCAYCLNLQPEDQGWEEMCGLNHASA